MSEDIHMDTRAMRQHDGASRREWWVLMALALLALVLGILGFMHDTGADGHPMDPLDPLYRSFQLFHMHYEHAPYPMPWELEVARFLAPFVLVVTIFKGFIYVAKSQRHAWMHRSQRGHMVICGLGEKGLQLALDYKNNRHARVVVVEKDPQNELLSACDHAGIFYLIGDATEPAVLEHARVAYAKEIVIVAPDDETNLRIAMEIQQLKMPADAGRPRCFVHLENIHLRDRLQDLYDVPSQDGRPSFQFFDVYDYEARRVLLDLPIDGPGIPKNDPRSVHLVIIGFGRMGRSVALRAAKMGQFANGKPLRISVIDHEAEARREHLLFHFPMLKGEEVCELKFYQEDARSLTARSMIGEWASEPHSDLHIFVCLDDNTHAVEVGLRLQEILADQCQCTLCVRVTQRTSLARIFEAFPERRPKIFAFGMVENTSCYESMRRDYHEDLARAIHENFVSNRLADSTRSAATDPALRPWTQLREDFRESNRQQADHIPIKLRAIGCRLALMSDPVEAVATFTQEEIDVLAPMEHRRWNAERWLNDWRYGFPSNRTRRISEYLVDWEDLPPPIQEYDVDEIKLIPKLVALMTPPRKVIREKANTEKRPA